MKEKLNIEQLFKSKLEGAEYTPSAEHWLKTKRALKRKQFFRFQSKRFNVYHTLGIALLGAAALVLIEKNNSKDISISEHGENQISSQVTSKEEVNSQANKSNSQISKTEKPKRKNKIHMADSANGAENETSSNLNYSKSNIDSISPNKNSEYENMSPQAVNTLLAYFTPSIYEGCAPLKVKLINSSLNAEKYEWNIGNRQLVPASEIGHKQSFHTFTEPGIYTITLTASGANGITRSHTEQITVHPSAKADFSIEDNIIYNNSLDATEFEWKLSDNLTKTLSTDFQPELSNLRDNRSHAAERPDPTLILIAKNNLGCVDTASKTLPLPPASSLKFPSAFSPNPNGATGGYYSINEPDNSIFYPTYMDLPASYELTIYNKNGTQLFRSTDINTGWDGYYKEAAVISGVYIYRCSGKWSNGQVFNYQGDITLIQVNN